MQEGLNVSYLSLHSVTIISVSQRLTLSLFSALFLFLGVPQWQHVGRLWG